MTGSARMITPSRAAFVPAGRLSRGVRALPPAMSEPERRRG